MAKALLLITMLLAPTTALWAVEPTAPAQPASGPGGAAYAHAAMAATRHGHGDHEFWLIEPADPKPASAPVAVFLHGWGAMSPNIYGAWIEHLVRRGNIVVFPRYQATIATPSFDFTDNTVHAVRNAFNTLRQGDHVRPIGDRVVFAGHSVGGLLAANLAARADGRFIPTPRAVLSLQPGISREPGKLWGIPLADLSRIAPATLLVTCAGDRDATTGDHDARRVFAAASAVPNDRKSLLLFRTDRHGEPALVANHRSPASLKAIVDEPPPAGDQAQPDEESPPVRRMGRAIFNRLGSDTVDAMDHFGYWAILDRLIDVTAKADPDADAVSTAIGANEAGRAAGRWSDGRAILPPLRVLP